MNARQRFETGGRDMDDGPSVRVLPDRPPVVIPPSRPAHHRPRSSYRC